jgi:hypothetical protein
MVIFVYKILTKIITLAPGDKVQEGEQSGFRAGGQHQVLPRVLGRQLEEEAEGAKRLLLRANAPQAAPAGSF